MTGIRLRRWSESDAKLLFEANEEGMTEFIAGPESAAEVAKRHDSYLERWVDGTARMFVILDGEYAVGGIGWWQMEWEGDPSVETGWFVLPRAQGRGVATAAVRLIIQDAVAFAPSGCHLYALPSMWNVLSNALCNRAGFELTGQHYFPFRGQVLHVNVWKHALASVELSSGPHGEISLPMPGDLTSEHRMGPVIDHEDLAGES